MNTVSETPSTQPGIGAALVAFAVFLAFVLGAQALSQDLPPEDPWSGIEAGDHPRIETIAVLSRAQAGSRSQEFRSGEVVVVAGDGIVDLGQAELAARGGRLEIVVVFGKVRVRVPEGWTVVTDTDLFLGSFDHPEGTGVVDPTRRLEVEAVVLAGAVEITH